MSDMSKFNEMFDELYLTIGSLIRNKPEYYDCRVVRDSIDVTASKTPLITIDVTDSYQRPYRSSMDHTENQIQFTVTVDIITEDYKNINRRKIGEDLREVIYDYFVHQRGLMPNGNHRLPMHEEKKYRALSRFTGVYDIETKIIYKT